MKFSCDQCGTRYSIADEKVEGKILKIRCKVCEFTMVVRGSDHRIGGSISSMASVASQVLPAHQEVEWYAAIGHRQLGPLPRERLDQMFRTGDLTEENLVWNETMDDWMAAGTVDELSSTFVSLDKAKPPPLPSGPPSIPSQRPDDSLDGLEADVATPPSAAPIADVDTEHLEAPTEVESFASLLGTSSPILSRPTEKMLPEDQPSMGSAASVARPQDIDTENRVEGAKGLESLGPESGEEASDGPESTHAYPPFQPAEPDDEDTALLNLDALVHQSVGPGGESSDADRAAAPRDVSTRRLTRDSEPPASISAEPVIDVPVSSVESEPEIASIVIAESAVSEPPLSLPKVSQDLVPEVSAEPLPVESEHQEFTAPGLHFSDPSQDGLSDTERSPIIAPDESVETPVGRALSPDSVITKRGDGGRVGSSRPTVSPGLVVMACIMGMAVMGLIVHFVIKDRPEQAQDTKTAASQGGSPSTDPTPSPSKTVVESKSPKSPNMETAKASVQTTPVIPATPPDASVPMDIPETPIGVPEKTVASQTKVPAKTEKPSGLAGPKTVPRKSRSSRVAKVTSSNKRRKKAQPELDIDPLNLERGIDLKAPVPRREESGRAANSLRNRMNTSSRVTPSRLKDIDADRENASAANRPRFERSRGPESQLPERREKAAKSSGNRMDDGPIKQSDIKKVIKDHRKALNGCYERHLKKDPDYSPGKIKLRFTIRPTGRTEAVSIGKEHENTIMKRCLDRLVRRWKFPTFKGEPYKASVPLIFRQNF